MRISPRRGVTVTGVEASLPLPYQLAAHAAGRVCVGEGGEHAEGLRLALEDVQRTHVQAQQWQLGPQLRREGARLGGCGFRVRYWKCLTRRHAWVVGRDLLVRLLVRHACAP